MDRVCILQASLIHMCCVKALEKHAVVGTWNCVHISVIAYMAFEATSKKWYCVYGMTVGEPLSQIELFLDDFGS